MSDVVLVLGAAGFLGRSLCEALAGKGWKVLAATRRPARFEHAAITNVVASFDDTHQFVTHLPACRAVIHAASSTTPGSTAAQPQLEGNLRPTLALLEALQLHPRPRMIYLSSGGTLYGDRSDMPTETAPIRPRSYHGAGKAAAELFIRAWAEQFSGTAVVLRPSNVYGPGQTERRDFGIVPTAFARARDGTALTVWGDGEAVRDFLYVEDLQCLVHATLAAPLGPGAHVFNASSSRGIRINALLDGIEATTGRALHRDYQPARGIDIRRIVPDNRAAREFFGWDPRTELDEGLARTWRWFATRP